MEMEKVMESDIKVKEDIIGQIEKEQNDALLNIFELKALAELSMNTAIYPDESQKIDWGSIFDLFSRGLDAIQERLNEIDRLIFHYMEAIK
jgi:hypothetical protein